MSIIQSVLKQESKSSFVLVYGNKSPEETIFHQELHDLQLQFVGRFFVHYVYSQARVEGELFGVYAFLYDARLKFFEVVDALSPAVNLQAFKQQIETFGK